MHASLAAAGKTPYRYQSEILQKVSRTFALTIPQLSGPLRAVVTNAYLLCRIADTIEDESALQVEQKQYFLALFREVVAGRADADAFAGELGPLLVNDALDGEKELVSQCAVIIGLTHSFGTQQRAVLERCLVIMCRGMREFDEQASVEGLADVPAMDQYCYCVAGVVGETLTELFCHHSPAMAAQREPMLRLGVSFGQGLQMVNILKDFWEDHRRGVCWLPRNLFKRVGIDLAQVRHMPYRSAFGEVYAQLIGMAYSHLRNGLRYTLMIPSAEPGVRRFCLVALALAVQTLQRIHERPDFTSGSEVKVSHRVVTHTMLMTRLFAGYDGVLRRWFRRLGRGLPEAAVEADWFERIRRA